MSKREVICSKQIHCLSCPLSVQVTGKDCRQLTQREIDKILYREYIINISNNTIKYCYKADNIYDFERRLYFLSLIIEKKFIKELNVHETKKA